MKPSPTFVTRTRIPGWRSFWKRARKATGSEGNGRLVENALDRVALAPAASPAVPGARLRCENTVSERRDGNALDVVGSRIGPARDESARLDRAVKPLRAPRRDAEEEVLAAPRLPHDREHVVHELVGHGDALGGGLGRSELVEREHGCERREDAVGAARHEKAPLLLQGGISQRDAHEETVELRLGERVGAEVL